jgi:hypothetical protein
MKFIKTPVSGNKIKVYLQNKTYCFGIVKDVVMQNYFKYVPQGNTIISQQMAVVEKVDEVFDINSIDFFFEESRVIFV